MIFHQEDPHAGPRQIRDLPAPLNQPGLQQAHHGARDPGLPLPGPGTQSLFILGGGKAGRRRLLGHAKLGEPGPHVRQLLGGELQGNLFEPWLPGRLLLRLFEGPCADEAAAASGHRLDPDLPSHLLHQLATDGQPQAGALGSELTQLLPLLEGLEQPRQQLGTDAGPLIVHPAPDPVPVPAGPEHHLAVLAELDGVGEQVVQHLLHPVGIERHQGRQCRIQVEAHLQVLGTRLGPVHRRHMLAQLHQIGRLHGEPQLAVLVAAEIEHVVEQPEQLVARLPDVRQHRGLLRGEFGLIQPLQQAQDSVHGGADLVAHGGEEAPLGEHGLLGLLVGELQGVLLLDPVGHILHHPKDAPPLPLTAPPAGELQPARALGRMLVAQQMGEGAPGLQHGQHGGTHLPPVLVRDAGEGLVGIETDLLAGQPQQLMAAAADELHPGDGAALQGELQHHPGHRIGEGPQAALRLAQQAGALAQGADVGQGDEIPGRGLGPQAQRDLGIGVDLIPQGYLPLSPLQLRGRQDEIGGVARLHPLGPLVALDHLPLVIAQEHGHG
ncbi:hypothetical protein D3C87_844220 [compost metagenome]